jgi:hypothetical protein
VNAGLGGAALASTLGIDDDRGMASPSLEQLQEIVADTTLEDWQVVVDAVRETPWPMRYEVDAVPVEMPPTVEEMFAQAQKATILWSVIVAPGVAINCHFFSSDEIEFDFQPREIVSDERLAALLGFITHVGRALGRLVGVTVEGNDDPRPAKGHLYYEPLADATVAEVRSGVIPELWPRRVAMSGVSGVGQ